MAENTNYLYKDAAVRRKKIFMRIANGILLTFLFFLILFPILWMLQMSFREQKDLFQMPPDMTSGWTIQNYISLSKTNFGRNMLNSVIVSTSTSVVSLLFGIPAAYAISRYRFKREKVVSFWILAARLALPIGFALPLFNIFKRLGGMNNTYPGIVIAYLTFSIPLVIWVLRPFLDTVPVEVEESAIVDGASHWQALIKIVIPLAAPGIVSVGILTFIMTWIEFFYALVFTRGNMMTAPVGVVNFLQYAGWEWGKITSAGIVIMLPVIIFSVFTHKYLISGLTAGAVKG
jgi:multiple sugar transport system permease protein